MDCQRLGEESRSKSSSCLEGFHFAMIVVWHCGLLKLWNGVLKCMMEEDSIGERRLFSIILSASRRSLVAFENAGESSHVVYDLVKQHHLLRTRES